MSQHRQTKLDRYSIPATESLVTEPEIAGPDSYHFEVTRYQDGKRLVVNQKSRAGSGWIVGDRATAVSSIQRALEKAAAALIDKGPLPTSETVIVAISEELNFKIDAAEVVPDQDSIESNRLV